MKGIVDRQFFAELVILVGACVGAWILLVDPVVAERQRLDGEIAKSQSEAVRVGQLDVAQLADRIDDARSITLEVEHRNRVSKHSAQLYDAIMRRARKHDVSVEHIEPGQLSGDDDATVRASTFRVYLEGDFEDVTIFLDELMNIDGYVRPVALNLAPRGYAGSFRVSAQLTAEAMLFAIPDVLAEDLTVAAVRAAPPSGSGTNSAIVTGADPMEDLP